MFSSVEDILTYYKRRYKEDKPINNVNYRPRELTEDEKADYKEQTAEERYDKRMQRQITDMSIRVQRDTSYYVSRDEESGGEEE